MGHPEADYTQESRYRKALERGNVAIDKTREVIAGVGVSAGLMSLWLAVVMHSASALLGGTVIGLVAAFAIAAVSQGR